jgi:hypothetical protein
VQSFTAPSKIDGLGGVAIEPRHVGDNLMKVGALIGPVLVDDGLRPRQVQ